MSVRAPSLVARLCRCASTLAVALVGIASPFATRAAAAQSWFTPSFQVPRTSSRDYTIAVAANSGTSALFQWREGLDANSHFGLEGGLTDADGPSGTKLLLGGSYAYQLARTTAEQPLDLLLTAGAGLAVGDGPDLLRIPVGVSVGHRFELEGDLAITPYVHPRLSLDFVTGRRAEGVDRTDLALDFDLGASLEITRQLALRTSLVLSGSGGGDDVGFGIGLTITPSALRR